MEAVSGVVGRRWKKKEEKMRDKIERKVKTISPHQESEIEKERKLVEKNSFFSRLD